MAQIDPVEALITSLRSSPEVLDAVDVLISELRHSLVDPEILDAENNHGQPVSDSDKAAAEFFDKYYGSGRKGPVSSAAWKELQAKNPMAFSKAREMVRTDAESHRKLFAQSSVTFEVTLNTAMSCIGPETLKNHIQKMWEVLNIKKL